MLKKKWVKDRKEFSVLEHAKFRPQGSSRCWEYQSPVINPKTHIHTPLQAQKLLRSCPAPATSLYLSIQVLLNAATPYNVFKPRHVQVRMCVCVWDVSKAFCKMMLFLFILTEHTQCCGFSHNLTGKWHHLLLTLMMNRTIPQSGYNVAMDSLRTVCKFITALWYHRITVVEIAFTSAEFTASFL